jgi:AcrR family transcriptional regulator
MHAKKRELPPSRPARRSEHKPGALTRLRILDMAELLFAERGFGGVSLREIIAKVGVNVGAVHYHFGSKHELFEQVVARLAEPFYGRMLALLKEAEAWSGHESYLERIVEAMIAPSFRAPPGEENAIRNYNRIRAHIFVEDQEFARELISKYFGKAARHALAALRRAMPELSPQELLWRLHILRASLVFTTIPSSRFYPVPIAVYAPEDAEEAIAYLVPLTVAMFRAPPVGATARKQAARRRKEPRTREIQSAGQLPSGSPSAKQGRRSAGPSRAHGSPARSDRDAL